MKTRILAAVALATVAAFPVLAQDKMEKMDAMGKMECTDADMATMETKMKAMTDANKQKMAMGEMDMAKKMMASKDMDGCKMHMDKAMDSMDMMKK
ncbi:MAG: hypothetical protein ABI457_12555 [Hyphomicrobium sp.]